VGGLVKVCTAVVYAYIIKAMLHKDMHYIVRMHAYDVK